MADTHTQQKRRRQFWRASGATLIALVLWGILSLSQTYTITLDVPLAVEIDTTHKALATRLPSQLEVTARGDGWTLMQIAANKTLRSQIDTSGQLISSNDSLRVFSFNERDLVNSINSPSSVQIERVWPGNLEIKVANLVTKRVPLFYPDITIQTRTGFQVIGKPFVRPDSVRLSGSEEALENVTHWYTQPLNLQDIFTSTRMSVPVSDSMKSVISVTPEEAIVSVDVQEIAEVTFEDLPIINRSKSSDTALGLRFFPNRITVTLRGGAGELGDLRATDIVPLIELVAGVDTSGFVRPHITLPKDMNISVISVNPERVRYIWRKQSPAISGE